MPRPPVDPDVTAIEVERRGMWRYVVVMRREHGFGSEWMPGHLFRWTAVRHARRLAAGHQFQTQVVFSAGQATVGRPSPSDARSPSGGDGG